jgi:alginate O-acetyltransferase complex protein AlgJ
MLPRLTLQRLPIFACAGFLGLMLIVNIWNVIVSENWPKLRIRSADPLWGLTSQKPAPLMASALISGAAQKAISTGFAQKQPVFPISVRARNQFLYSAFNLSGAPSIVVGKAGQLYEKLYIREFCARGAASDAARIDAWASKLAAIQKGIEARGKRFVFVITPSKAARLVQYLPADVACLALARGSTEKLAPYLAALDAQGVAYVDAASLMTRAARDYPIDLFPRGGTHWNLLGAGLAARDMSRRLDADGKSPLPAYDFDWRQENVADGTDADLLKLLNLLWPDNHYPVAALDGRSARACEKRPRVFAVGGSFLIEPLIALMESPCGLAVDYWHYFTLDSGELHRARHIGEERNIFEAESDPALETTEAYEKGLAASDVVLLEENETAVGGTAQVDDLLAAVAR